MRGAGTSGAILDCNDVVDLDSDCEVTPQGNKEVSNSTFLCDGTQSTRCYDVVLSNGVVPPPFVGMIFASWGDIDTYFRNYGRQQGFGILRASGSYTQKKVVSNSLRGYMWKCECYGSTTYRRRINGKRVVAEREGPVKRKSKKCDCLKEDINAAVRRKLFTDVGSGSKEWAAAIAKYQLEEDPWLAVADCVPIVIDTLRQLDINMEATVNAAGLSGITLTKKTPPKSTKKSPASSKKKTPKSMNKGKWTVTETGKQSIMDVSPTCFEIGSPSTDLLVNDPVSRKKPHRTPSCMHRSCVEKSKKRTPKRSKSVKKTALHPQVNSDEVLRLSAGGIEMLTENGSVGYFTSTVEEDSDGFVLCGDDDGDVLGMDVDDVGVVGLDGDGGDDLLTQHDLVWV
uniref:FAR1 domain-containing protein n=1 Tax=Chenopodium quinoa TaxID=63459 RepID=A0A803MX10_CHEQI